MENENAPFMPQFTIKIPNAAKNGDVVEFFIEAIHKDDEKGMVVIRVFDDFQLLHHMFCTLENGAHVIVPPLPSKPVASAHATMQKSKKQLGHKSAVLVGDDYGEDCKIFEKFLMLCNKHSVLGLTELLKNFLCMKEPPTRVRVRRGILDSISKAVDERRYSNFKDVDDDYQNLRKKNEEAVVNMKSAASNYQKMVDREKRLSSSFKELSHIFQSDTVTGTNDMKLKEIYTKAIEGMEIVTEASANNAAKRQSTLACALHLYAKYEDSKKSTLQKRTQKLIELDSAKRAFETANPPKKDQADQDLKRANKAVTDISHLIKQEMEVYHRERLLAMQQAMIQFAEAEIKIARDAYALLAKTVLSLQQLEI